MDRRLCICVCVSARDVYKRQDQKKDNSEDKKEDKKKDKKENKKRGRNSMKETPL